MFNSTNSILPIILLSLFFITSISINAQDEEVLLLNKKRIDIDRYRDIRGTPYLFKEWKKGIIISINSKVKPIDNVLLNYNGETNSFEIKKGNQFIELDQSIYLRILVENEKGAEKIIYQKGFIHPLKGKFSRLIYEGETISIIQQFTSKITTKVFNNVGKNEEFKSFYNKKQYFIIKDNKSLAFKLKKKKVLGMLTQQSQLEKFLKKEKMKLDSEEQLIKLLKYYEKEIIGNK